MKKLKPSHYEALSRLAAQHDGRLRWLRGGFWTDDPTASEFSVELWNTTKPVVTEMSAAKLIEPVTKREFKLTQLGLEALNSGVCPC